MQPFNPTIVLRHRKENLKKCSLRGLETRNDFKFFSYPLHQTLPDLSNYVLLTLDAPVLSDHDKISNPGLFLIDGTWRYASIMLKQIESMFPHIEKRSLPPHYRTAYPRKQDDCPNPDCGLSSIEAIYIAYHILSRDPTGLLDNYYWKEPFFEKNQL